MSDVLVIGGGLAGLSAAVALSGAGAKVTLLERKPYIGGRAYSYLHPALDDVIDSQHVMLGCCTNLVDLCRLSGADKNIKWYDDITFLEPGNPPRRSVLGPGWMPAPGHTSMAFLRAPMLSLADKMKIAAGLMQFVRGVPESDAEPFSEWLRRTGQSRNAVLHFWEPVIVGALNDSFERCSTRYAAQVFYESFLKNAGGGRLGIPTLPMTAFYEPVAELAKRQGTEFHLRASVETLTRAADGRWEATTSEGAVFAAEKVVLALPFEQARRLLSTLPENEAARAMLPMTEHFVHAPITTLHLWFDREVTDMDHAALLDTRIQWMFNKTRIRETREAGQYLELVISASFPEVKMSREEILQPALRELAGFFPKVNEAKVVKSGVLKEARATFSVLPGLDAFRPEPKTGSEGLYLAGDWVKTDWPSTMEGAVRSGRLAAEAIASRRFLSSDRPADGLMKFVPRC